MKLTAKEMLKRALDDPGVPQEVKEEIAKGFQNPEVDLEALLELVAGDQEGKKYDFGKARYDLLPPEALHVLVLVYSLGARKYGDRNWERGMKYSRPYAAAQRHLWAWWRGEDLDPETGLPHLAHAAWNVLALLQYQLKKRGEDDRPNGSGE